VTPMVRRIGEQPQVPSAWSQGLAMIDIYSGRLSGNSPTDDHLRTLFVFASMSGVDIALHTSSPSQTWARTSRGERMRSGRLASQAAKATIPPDPGMGVAIELARRDPRGEGDLLTICETVAGVGGATKAPPPGLNHVQPAGANGNEDLLNAGMGGEPLTDGAAGVAREMVGDQIEVPDRVVLINRLKRLEIAGRVACGRRLGADLPLPEAQRSVDPRLVVAAAGDEWGFEAVAIGRPGGAGVYTIDSSRDSRPSARHSTARHSHSTWRAYRVRQRRAGLVGSLFFSCAGQLAQCTGETGEGRSRLKRRGHR
jgi:hypothetical protein